MSTDPIPTRPLGERALHVFYELPAYEDDAPYVSVWGVTDFEDLADQIQHACQVLERLRVDHSDLQLRLQVHRHPETACNSCARQN